MNTETHPQPDPKGLAEKFQALRDRITDYANSELPRVYFLQEISRLLLEFTGSPFIELRLKKDRVGGKWELCRHTRQDFEFKIIPPPSPPSLETAIPMTVGSETVGYLVFDSAGRGDIFPEEHRLYRELVLQLGLVLVSQRSQADLLERVKELTCLIAIAQVGQQTNSTLAQILRQIVELLPPAWQYPEITAARITLDSTVYDSPGFRETPYRQYAPIMLNELGRGSITVVYLEERPEIDEGPFLDEERKLINTIAAKLSTIIKQRETAEEKTRLREQLLHADRLATIGQLTAGVAHELNEPLGNILGFAQLAQKNPQLPQTAARDIENIITSSLYCREIIKKLMIFTRQTPFTLVPVDINRAVEDGLYFLESRCTKEGIELIRRLTPGLPPIMGDPPQLNQILVNLVVNAVHAMPDGGRLTLETYRDGDRVALVAEDTGIGMSEELIKKIFIPFFTTKEVGKGTGLGLSVIHGIVKAHNAAMEVSSRVGTGSRFEIKFPLAPPNSVPANVPEKQPKKQPEKQSETT